MFSTENHSFSLSQKYSVVNAREHAKFTCNAIVKHREYYAETYTVRVPTVQSLEHFRLAGRTRSTAAPSGAQVLASLERQLAREVAIRVLFERVARLLTLVIAAREVEVALLITKVERDLLSYGSIKRHITVFDMTPGP